MQQRCRSVLKESRADCKAPRHLSKTTAIPYQKTITDRAHSAHRALFLVPPVVKQQERWQKNTSKGNRMSASLLSTVLSGLVMITPLRSASERQSVFCCSELQGVIF